VSGPSQVETLEHIFRKEALERRGLRTTAQSVPLRLSTRRLRLATWALVGAVAVGLALAALLAASLSSTHGSSGTAVEGSR
jgi:hypothetical protein